jgi:hypothetical protein
MNGSHTLAIGYRRLHAGVDADLLQRVLHRERVHHRRQHPHVIAGRAIHAARRARDAAEDVAAADHHAQFISHRAGVGDFMRDAGGDGGVDREPPLAHQDLARQLQQDTLESGGSHETFDGQWAGGADLIGAPPGCQALIRCRIGAGAPLPMREDSEASALAKLGEGDRNAGTPSPNFD